MSEAQHQPQIPDGCKFTQVGAIPNDWEVRALRACLVRDPDYGINAAAVPLDDSLPAYIRITDISDDGRFAPAPAVSVRDRSASAYYLNDGDLVFARTGASVGKSYRYRPSDGALVFAGFLIRVTPDPATLDPAFLGYFVQSKCYWDWVAAVSIRSGQPGINGQEYGSLHIPVPDITEQHAIAEALADVDRLIEAFDTLIAKKQAVKQAAMQHLLTGRTRLPGFIRKWQTMRLGDHVKYLNHGVNSRAELSAEGAVRYLHYGDVHASAGPRLDPVRNPLPHLPTEKSTRLDRLEGGDLVLVDASEDLAGVGKSVELSNVKGVEIVAGLHTIAARFDKAVLADGFKGYLQYMPAFKSQLERLAAGTKVYATNRAHVSGIELALPSIEEQCAIAAVLSNVELEIEALERQRDKTKQIKRGMMQQLLTGRTRLIEQKSYLPSAPAEAGGWVGKSHSWAFNEAVLISTLAKHFGKDEFPLGRKRYTKLSYLVGTQIDPFNFFNDDVVFRGGGAARSAPWVGASSSRKSSGNNWTAFASPPSPPTFSATV